MFGRKRKPKDPFRREAVERRATEDEQPWFLAADDGPESSTSRSWADPPAWSPTKADAAQPPGGAAPRGAKPRRPEEGPAATAHGLLDHADRVGDGVEVVAVGGHVEGDAVEAEADEVLDLLADRVGVAHDEAGAEHAP